MDLAVIFSYESLWNGLFGRQMEVKFCVHEDGGIRGRSGVTVFLGTTPSRYRLVPELCADVTMPTTVSSLTPTSCL